MSKILDSKYCGGIIITIMIIVIDNGDNMNAPIRKHSKKRDAILKELQGTTLHPSASWVYERLKQQIPDLSLATVYRNIAVLRQENQLMFVGVVNGEERFDAVVMPHPHLVCESCGSVIDLPPYESVGMYTKAAERIDHNKTVFTGVCKNCVNNA